SDGHDAVCGVYVGEGIEVVGGGVVFVFLTVSPEDLPRSLLLRAAGVGEGFGEEVGLVIRQAERSREAEGGGIGDVDAEAVGIGTIVGEGGGGGAEAAGGGVVVGEGGGVAGEVARIAVAPVDLPGVDVVAAVEVGGVVDRGDRVEGVGGAVGREGKRG